MLERKKYQPGVDHDEFREIQKKLPEHLKMRVFICEYEGKPVTATIGSAIGNTGIYLLGATGDKGLQLKGAYLSQWLMIQWMKEHGCHWYDLGGINPEKNPGVYHFKAGLSGRDVHHIGQYELCQNLISSFSVKLFEKFVYFKNLKSNT
jgi:lipid II:glycine glycyltransferase (peptidoglycan interpeptide bridge formation enzyme)